MATCGTEFFLRRWFPHNLGRLFALRQPVHFSGSANKVLQTIITQGVGYPQLLDDLRAIIRHEVGQAQALAPSAPAAEEELLTVRQAATLLDVCVATIHEWKRRGLLPYTRLGGRVYLKKADVLSAGTRCRRSEK
jgi:excisionase family DNA binding protein